MQKGHYRQAHDQLWDLLQKAKEPGADFKLIAFRVDAVGSRLKVPDYQPISWAKFAVKRCLGPRKIKDGTALAEADVRLSSCRKADSQYFDEDGNLRPEYRD